MPTHLPTFNNPALREMIVSKEAIEKQATQAAQQGQSLRDACPYPFETPAGEHFMAAYWLALPKGAGPCTEDTRA